jgi:hypothetical protein
VNDAALLQLSNGAAATDTTSVQAMFQILDAKVRVISASIGLLRQWSILYAGFRTRPGPADVTVVVSSPGDAEQPRPGEAAVIVGEVVQPWTGSEPLFPPLWVPPLDRWLCLSGTAVGRAGQAVLLLSESSVDRTLLAVAMVARGAWLLADELVPIDPDDLLVAPFPKSLRLHREALRMLGIDLAHPALVPFRTSHREIEWRAEPDALVGAGSSRVAADAGAVVFLEPARSEQPRLAPLPPREALTRLCTQLHRLPTGFQTGMDALVRLCSRTPAYSFASGSPGRSARVLDEALLV